MSIANGDESNIKKQISKIINTCRNIGTAASDIKITEAKKVDNQFVLTGEYRFRKILDLVYEKGDFDITLRLPDLDPLAIKINTS